MIKDVTVCIMLILFKMSFCRRIKKLLVEKHIKIKIKKHPNCNIIRMFLM